MANFNMGGALAKMKDKMFCRPQDLVFIDLSTGQIAIKGDGNLTSLTIKDEKAGTYKLVNQQIEAFVKPIPAIAMRKDPKDLVLGDIIIIKGKKNDFARFVTKVNKKTGEYESVRPTGSKAEFVEIEDSLTKTSGVLVVSNFLGKGGKVDTNALLPLMLMGDSFGDGDSDSLMTLMMMGGGGGLDQNAMLPLLLMGDSCDGDGGGMETMLLMQALQGNNGKGKGDINSMLPFLLMGKGKGAGGGKMKDILLMQAMSGGKGGIGDLFGKDSNPMLMMALLG